MVSFQRVFYLLENGGSLLLDFVHIPRGPGQVSHGLMCQAKGTSHVRAVNFSPSFLKQSHPQLMAVGLSEKLNAPLAWDVIVNYNLQGHAILVELHAVNSLRAISG